jgi:hypothetical protein
MAMPPEQLSIYLQSLLALAVLILKVDYAIC